MVRCIDYLGQGGCCRSRETNVRGHLTYLANRICLNPTSKAVFFQQLGDFEDSSMVETLQFGNNGLRYVIYPGEAKRQFEKKLRRFEEQMFQKEQGEISLRQVERALPVPLPSAYENLPSFHHPTRGVFATFDEVTLYLSFYLKASRSVDDEMHFLPPTYRDSQTNFMLFTPALGLTVVHPRRPRTSSPTSISLLDDDDFSFRSSSSSSSDDEKDNSSEQALFKLSGIDPLRATH